MSNFPSVYQEKKKLEIIRKKEEEEEDLYFMRKSTDLCGAKNMF